MDHEEEVVSQWHGEGRVYLDLTGAERSPLIGLMSAYRLAISSTKLCGLLISPNLDIDDQDNVKTVSNDTGILEQSRFRVLMR